MASIDYNIPLQFKGVQIEPPENAMARAMQLRQLQESSEMNALRRQEAKTKEKERQRALSKEQLVEAVSDLTSYDTVASVLAGVRQKVANGLVTQAQADKVIAGLPKNDFELPAWQIRTMRSLLPAKEQYAELKAARDAAYEDYATSETFAGRSPLPRQDWERRTAPAAAPTVAPTVAPTAEAAPITAPTPTSTQGFMPVELGVPYDVYVKNAIVGNQERVLGRDAYEAEQQRLAQMKQPAPANALAANVAPANALVSPPVAVDVQAGAEKALPNVAVQGKRVGFDYLDPQAQALYELAARTKDKEKAATYRATAKEIQDAHVAALKERQLTGGFLNVYNAEKLIADLEKEEQTPLVKRQIATLREAIKAENEGRGIRVTATATTSPAGKSLAGPIGERAEKSLVQAEGAAGIMESANMVREALNAGNVIAGPLAGMRTKFAQVLELANAGDKQKLINTRTAIQGLATLTLESRAELRGQGQVTENEQKLLERARSGSIEDMTVAELQQIVNVSQRLASRLWSSHENLLKRMESDPAARDVIRYYRPTVTLPSAVGQSSPQSETDKRNQGLNKIFGGKP